MYSELEGGHAHFLRPFSNAGHDLYKKMVLENANGEFLIKLMANDFRKSLHYPSLT
jgi:hypothetical protein